MSFNEQQKAALAAKLDASHVKSRSQAGRSLSYIEGWWVIAEANRIFGFDRWDRQTVEMRQLGEPREVDGKWRVAYMAKVTVIVRTPKADDADGMILRDGTGYGSGIDRDLGSAHESAIKEAETDAMKRALMTFGNPFGLALYDKEQAEVERNGNGHTKPAEPADPDKETARQMYANIVQAIAAAAHPGDNALGLKLAGNGKDREDIAFIRKHGGAAAADKLHTLAAHKIAELHQRMGQ